MTSWLRRSSRERGLFSVLLGALLLSACSGDAVSVDFGVSDVEQVEVYLYDYADMPTEVTRSVITDRVEVAEFVEMFTDIPVESIEDAVEQVPGASTAGLRFVLRDGSTWEITRVFVVPKVVVFIWPDGRTAVTEWGSDIRDYGTPADPDANEPVDPGERPRAVSP